MPESTYPVTLDTIGKLIEHCGAKAATPQVSLTPP
jgi:hypothetical protein